MQQFFLSTNGCNWKENTGWFTEPDFCDWFGVTCDAGGYIELSFLGNNLQGPLPTELGNLNKLYYLDLEGNDINGTLPTQLGNLLELEVLALDQSKRLTGPIPTELGKLILLYHFSAANTTLTGSLPSEIGQMASLETLLLPEASLSGALPTEIGNLVNMIEFDFFFQRSEFGLDETMPTEFGNMVNLTFLELAVNSLSGTIPTFLGNCVELEYLSLFDNQLGGTVPTELGKLTNLEIFYADTQLNMIGAVPDEVCKLVELAENPDFYFDCRGNMGGAMDCSCFSDCCPAKLPLIISTPAPTGRTPSPTPNTGTPSPTPLSCNQLANNFECGTSTQVCALQQLFLSTDGCNWNDFTGWFDEPDFCDWFGVTCNNGRVEELSFVNNNLGGELPPELGDLTDVYFIELEENSISGVIPTELGDLVALEVFGLDGNFGITGPIPSQLGRLTLLYYFSAVETSLTSSLPTEIGNMAALEVFDLTKDLNNNGGITGALPTEFGKLANMASLLLFQASLSGTLPTEIGGMVSIIEFDVSYQQSGSPFLNGPVPTEIGKLVNAQSLVFSGNYLTGTLPTELGNCVQLQFLQFFENELSGTIPSELGNLNDLVVLDLEIAFGNMFGPVPDEVCQLVEDNIDQNPEFYFDCGTDVDCSCFAACCPAELPLNLAGGGLTI